MSNLRNFIVEDAMSASISNAVQYFDAILANDPVANQSVIRGITSAALGCQPVTCAGMIDEAFQCANGIEKDIALYDNGCCPITVSVFKNDFDAVPVPVSGVFGDQSASFQAGECVTIQPKRMYSLFKLDARNCYNSCASQADVIKMMTAALVRANLNAVRKDIWSAIVADAGTAITNPAGGDLLTNIQAVFNSVNDLDLASGKNVMVYANKQVINRLMQLRDDNGQPLFQSEGRCPISDCVEICYGGIKIKEIDSKILPVTGGVTDIFAAIPEHIKGTYSPVKVYTKDWTTTLTDTDNVIMAEVCVGAKIPTTLAGSAKKISVSIV
jgi:hypothetical protein